MKAGGPCTPFDSVHPGARHAAFYVLSEGVDRAGARTACSRARTLSHLFCSAARTAGVRTNANNDLFISSNSTLCPLFPPRSCLPFHFFLFFLFFLVAALRCLSTLFFFVFHDCFLVVLGILGITQPRSGRWRTDGAHPVPQLGTRRHENTRAHLVHDAVASRTTRLACDTLCGGDAHGALRVCASAQLHE